jgi:hypothetical protein
MYGMNYCVHMISFLLFMVFLLILCQFLTYFSDWIAYCNLALIHDEFHILSNLCG